MITVEGICEQLRRYNQFKNTDKYYIILNPDTSCNLLNADNGKDIEFGNPYQLMEYFTEHTGVRK